MQDTDYRLLQDKLAEKIQEGVPAASLEDIRGEIRAAFEKVKEAGKIDELTVDEVCLLRDYRLWKAKPGTGVEGVFHWKRVLE